MNGVADNVADVVMWAFVVDFRNMPAVLTVCA